MVETIGTIFLLIALICFSILGILLVISTGIDIIGDIMSAIKDLKGRY